VGLLGGGSESKDYPLILPTIDLQPILALVNRSERDSSLLDEDLLACIEKLSENLGNRKLKGFGLWDQGEILKLSPTEVDLGRTLLIAEMGSGAKPKIQSYEAMLDLMALQIKSKAKT